MELRVIGIRRTWINKLDEPEEELTQYLQRRVERKYTFFGLLSKYYWETIDKKIVPSFAWISVGCFGSTDWESKFKYIPNCQFTKI